MRMRSGFKLRVGLLVVLSTAVHQGASGQSLLGTRGLGLPLEPLDARARALGSVGVGLMGASLMPTDPASAAGLVVPTVNLTFQPHWGSASFGSEGSETQGTRFPLIGLAYPVTSIGGMATLTFGGFMDQRWELRSEGTVELGGTPVATTDIFKSEGGISALRVGWAQRLGERLTLAASVGSHTGSVVRTFVRQFDTLAVTTDIVPYTDGGKWQFSGLTTAFGIGLRVSDFLLLGSTLTLSGDLDAEPSKETKGGPATYALPLEVRAAATGVLTPRLLVHLGASFADWQSSAEGLGAEAVVGQVLSYGGGVEWAGPGLGSRTFPLRLGYRRSELPFRFGDDDPVETVFSGGLGLNFTQVEDLVLAGIDLALERGSRESGSLSETFWRATFSVRVAGF